MRRTLRNGPIDVDQIVANYTALGRAQRRKNTKRRWVRASIAASIVTGAAATWLTGLPTRLLETQRTESFGDLRSLVLNELDKLSAARSELAAERDRFAAKSAELETQLTAFATRQAAIESQQTGLSVQSAELRAALERTDAAREALVAAQARNPGVDRELVAITEQRRALEQQWQTFANQGKQLSTELEALERQRDALEAERATMERQRNDLEALLNAAAAGPSAASDTQTAASDTETTASDNQLQNLPLPRTEEDLLFASAVDTADLGEMRAGVELPNGMNVAIGLTRSATINGEEHLASSLRIEDITAGLDPAALDAMRPLVIQNGTNNTLSPDFLSDGSLGFGTIIQNTRDNQEIRTSTIYDVSIQDVGSTIRDMAASQAVSDSMSLQR